MDTEKMKQDLGGGNVFEVGEPNTAFAQYFIIGGVFAVRPARIGGGKPHNDIEIGNFIRLLVLNGAEKSFAR